MLLVCFLNGHQEKARAPRTKLGRALGAAAAAARVEGVAQTNLPIEAMLKFEFVSIMTPSNTGLGSYVLVSGGRPFSKISQPKRTDPTSGF